MQIATNIRPWIAVFLVTLAMVLGGGGSPDPFTELLLQGAAVLALISWLLIPADRALAQPIILLLAAVVIAVPLVQLVPLPPELWHELPGRENARAALELVGLANSWMPITLVRPDTVASLLSLGPPLMVLIMVASLPLHQRSWVLAAVALAGFATVLLGSAQLAAGGNSLRLYRYTHVGWITGFQANRNATADVLAIAILSLAAWWRLTPSNRVPRWAVIAGLAIMELTLILTGSRAGIALSIPALVIALAMVGGAGLANPRRLAMICAGLAVAASGIFALAWRTPILMKIASRFDAEGDFRQELWKDGWDAAMAYWPVGGGMGGFTKLMLPFERLDVVDATIPNRAHNDYLELLIEAGALGMIALGIAAALLLVLAIRSWREDEVPRIQFFFSMGSMAVIAAHSLVDYPMRSMSLACLFAIAIGMLAAPAGPKLRATKRGSDA